MKAIDRKAVAPLAFALTCIPFIAVFRGTWLSPLFLVLELTACGVSLYLSFRNPKRRP